MEEKKAKIPYSVRSFFGGRSRFSSLFSKRNISSSLPLSLEKSKGFTLVELLLVIGMIGVLTVGSMIAINPAQQLKKSRDADRKSDLKIIQSALELYRSDNGSYPTGQTVGSIPTVRTCLTTGSITSSDDGTCDATATVYLQSVPLDSKTGLNYYYLKDSPSTGGYTIYSCLENVNDTDKLTASTNPVLPGSGVTGVMACPAGSLYYGVTNP